MIPLKQTLLLLVLALTLLPSLSLALNPAPGVLLVAREEMADPRFRETVVLLLQHDANGSFGLILNRPTHFTLEESFPRAEVFDNLDQLLWLGGPVATGSALVLLESHQPPSGARVVFDGIYVAGLRQLVFWLGTRGDRVRYRVYAGYAGWAGGQLDTELKRGDWTLKPADPATIFGHPGKMWDRQDRSPGPLLTAR